LGFKVLASHTRNPGEPSAGRERLSPTSALQGSIESQAAESPLPTISNGERRLRLVERIVLATGVVLFFLLLAKLGAGTVLANLQLVGWGIFLIIAAELLAFVANTLGWRAAFPCHSQVPTFGQLLLARIAGDGVNYLTPTATMGGEFVRIRMLQGQAPVTSLAASVIVAKLTQTIGLLGFVVCGLLLVVDELPLPAGAQWGIFASLVLFAAVLAGLLVLQRRGLLSPALRLAAQWRALRFLVPLRSSVEQIDAEMARVHRESPGRIALSSTIFALGFADGIIETYLILWFFGIPVTLKLALAMEVLGVVLNNLMFFVPLRAGTQEAGKSLVFVLLGLSAAQGLAAGVIYRIRELTWALIGLAILARSRLSIRSLPTSMESSALHARDSQAEPCRDRRAT
jgi:glycosyltransferase 2 family protein